MFQIIEAGLQTTLQGGPRVGYRHLGIPYAGPADALSMALANRLVENSPDATCLEITYGGFEAETDTACAIAITGAGGEVLLSDAPAPMHETLHVPAGARLKLKPARYGAR
ncbi:MAG: allophanate hydrolase subunit 2 family protein, partial [Pseudomonadota bacterium]